MRNDNEVAFPSGIYDLVDSQTFYGAFMDFDASPWPGAHVTAGVRMDGQEDTRSRNELAPVVSVRQSLLDDRISAYAAYGESHRWIPPLELERFAEGGFEIPMESLRGVELGVRGSTEDGRFTSRLSWFELKNRYAAGAVGSEPRIDEGITSGVELAVELKASRQLRGLLNVTRFASPRGTGERNRSPGDYTWLANAGVFYEPTPRWSLEAVVRYMDRFRTEFDDLSAAEAELLALTGPPFFIELPDDFDGYGRFRQSATTVVDVGASYRFGVRHEAMLSLGVYNLTNRRYNTFPELPQWELPNQMPGRQLHATLSIRF